MPEFRRPRHRAVWRVLESLNAKALARANCLFGGGTRIALELNEYRESEDIDFICCDITGYRSLRVGLCRIRRQTIMQNMRGQAAI